MVCQTAYVSSWGLLGLEDAVTQNIKVYPTVVSERLYVSSATSKDIRAVVYTLNGREIKLSLEQDYLDVTPLRNGFYILKVFDANSVGTYKFIKD